MPTFDDFLRDIVADAIGPAGDDECDMPAGWCGIHRDTETADSGTGDER